jgi:aspartate aminotransferase-like enzyme
MNEIQAMPGLRPDVDPDGLLEYSVVFTDRALNHMSTTFQGVMNELSTKLKGVYGADAVAIVPGGGTYGMEAVARQFATDSKCLVIRNGFFSFRWSQILEMGRISSDVSVLKAARTGPGDTAPFAPVPIETVVARIEAERPAVVFAPHVETSAGMLLPDDYVRAVADAVDSVGGLLVLDCIASGALWVDMRALGVDVLLSAPQKGWSASPCAALVMMSERALERLEATTSTSFACDLKKWFQIMQAYEGGAHAYHATMPTDALTGFRDALRETEAFGFDAARDSQWELGRRVRQVLSERQFQSVAASGFEAPGVVVSYTQDTDVQNGKRFAALGLQIAAGVPLQCDEGENFKTFRVGLFGLDKLADVDASVAKFSAALGQLPG